MYVPSDVELVAFAGCTQKFGGAVLLPLFGNIDINSIYNEKLNRLMRQAQMGSVLPEFLIGEPNSYNTQANFNLKGIDFIPVMIYKKLGHTILYINKSIYYISVDEDDVYSFAYRLELCWLKQQEELLPEEEAPIAWTDLYGYIPDYTEGLSVQEYLHKIRCGCDKNICESEWY